eukprot:TRINITY_DN1960_c0_g1_i5.p1 TRINITY_DN1960_c0_g1~~TRINITY_DN1960_c0_g1_i5.p1  ORF type:complete len:367 (+),score=96.77 TRINITY_DN1960_c0_g1_i5:154-1254(+)
MASNSELPSYTTSNALDFPLFQDYPLLDSLSASPSWNYDAQLQCFPLLGEEPECNSPVLALQKELLPKIEENVQEELAVEKLIVSDKKKKRKGRKPLIQSIMDEDEKKAMRAEKNRKFAKESRDRKRKYIERLEVELESVKSELAMYKARFSRYERIEKQRNSSSCELYDWLSYSYKEMESTEEHKDSTQLASSLKKIIESSIEERCKAVEDFTKIMLELAMPLVMRMYKMPSPDKDFCNPKDLMKSLDYKISLEDAQKFLYYVKSIFPEKEQYVKIASAIDASKNKIKGWMKELLNCQKKLQLELKKTYSFFLKNIIKNMQLDALGHIAGVVFYLSKKPEFSNYAIYQIRDKDFSVEDNCFTEPI